jgi:phage FluMu protein Com
VKILPAVFGLIVVVLVIIVLVVRGIYLAKHTWRCPNCGHEFRNSWLQMMFTRSIFGFYGMKCPKCKEGNLFQLGTE